jgi:hypothetical protein
MASTNVIRLQDKKLDLARTLLEDLESSNARLRDNKEWLVKIEQNVLKKVHEAIENDTLSPYKAAVAFKNIAEGMAKVETIRLGIYDRLSGTIGIWADQSNEEGEADANDRLRVDPEYERAAESMVLEMVKEFVALQEQGIDPDDPDQLAEYRRRNQEAEDQEDVG